MKALAILPLAAAAMIFSFSTPAGAQTLESCNAQCQQTYDTRANYCYTRYGGYNYDAELCIMNEYDVLIDCQRECEFQYGSYGSLNLRIPGTHTEVRSCG